MQGIFAIVLIFILQCVSVTGVAYAGDSVSFNPVPIAIEAHGAVPVGTVIAWPAVQNPDEMNKWLECNGQAVSQVKYPQLYAKVGRRTPNYYNQFLRGGTLAQVGQVVADSTRSHAHNIPAHNHTVSGSASSQKVTVGSQNVNGSASGDFIDYHQEAGQGPGYRGDGGQLYLAAQYVDTPDGRFPIINERGPEGMFGHNTLKTVTSAVTAKTSGGTYSTGGGSITGWTNTVAQSSDATGGAETAPQHIRVRYLIRALP